MRTLERIDAEHGTEGNRVYYLSTPSKFFPVIVQRMGAAKLNKPPGFARVVIEKPFGHDLHSAQELAAIVHKPFREQQIYRIDHYLGKETVQNIFAFRFANAIFEPVWNNTYVDHVQITVAESIGVEHRAAFYEDTGVVRDIVQNHLLQVLALVAMEPPSTFEADPVRDEKIKLLRAVAPMSFENAVRGQYTRGLRRRRARSTATPRSRASRPIRPPPTFVAAKLQIENWRWAGTPFYIRAGKRLAKRVTEIAVQFRRPPHLPFTPARGRAPRAQLAGAADPAGRGHLAAVRRQGARLDALDPHGQHGLPVRLGLHVGGARGLRDADPRRDPRRRHAVHPPGRCRAVVGDLRSAARPVGGRRPAAALLRRFVGPDRRGGAAGARRPSLATPVSTAQAVRLEDLTKVERELLRMRTRESGTSVRATTLNLVVYAAAREHLNRTLDALQLIGGSRPLRAIVIVTRRGADHGRGVEHVLAERRRATRCAPSRS